MCHCLPDKSVVLPHRSLTDSFLSCTRSAVTALLSSRWFCLRGFPPYSLTHSLTHSLIHSLTHPATYLRRNVKTQARIRPGSHSHFTLAHSLTATRIHKISVSSVHRSVLTGDRHSVSQSASRSATPCLIELSSRVGGLLTVCIYLTGSSFSTGKKATHTSRLILTRQSSEQKRREHVQRHEMKRMQEWITFIAASCLHLFPFSSTHAHPLRDN